MTKMRLVEFEALPAYECSDPTFHVNWLMPGRYWRRTKGVYDNKQNLILCYVESGKNELGHGTVSLMWDEVELLA